jgi:predicted AAA+ superfamily ATPase
MKIEDINPWWINGKVQEDYVKFEKRALFQDIIRYINDKQIVVLTGLRRVGKTVTLHHIIDLILKNNPKENIVYFSFDMFDDNIMNILERYSEKTLADIKKDKIFCFLDEVQKHKNWENELKAIYDNFHNIKFFISGSSSLFIEKKTKESLAGRAFSFVMNPLSFAEYLCIKKINFDEKKISLYENIIKKHLFHYFRTGGFPELAQEYDNAKISRYIKETVIDKIIYIDIPLAFKIEEPALLESILSIISNNPGIIFDYDSISNDLKRNRKTISNYISYLEKSFLIKKLYNYSKNTLTNEKKMKRFYPSSTALPYLFNAEEGRIIETAVNMKQDFRFFSRLGEKEIDFISATSKEVVPIEVKYQENIKEKDTGWMLSFIEKYTLKKGLIITKSIEQTTVKGRVKIEFIPLWKWLLDG